MTRYFLLVSFLFISISACNPLSSERKNEDNTSTIQNNISEPILDSNTENLFPEDGTYIIDKSISSLMIHQDTQYKTTPVFGSIELREGSMQSAKLQFKSIDTIPSLNNLKKDSLITITFFELNKKSSGAGIDDYYVFADLNTGTDSYPIDSTLQGSIEGEIFSLSGAFDLTSIMNVAAEDNALQLEILLQFTKS